MTAIGFTENFDFVTFTETFVDNNFEKSGTFYDYVKFVCSPVKLCYQRRCSGGLPLGEKHLLGKVIDRSNVESDNGMLLC